MSSLADAIREKARAIGFDVAGFSPAVPSPRRDALERWLADGMNAGMAWLGREVERRTDPGLVLPGARTIVSVGLSYQVEDPPPEFWNDPLRGRVARYAWGRDYHDVMGPMLAELADFIRSEAPAADPVLPAEQRTRSYVDTGPLLEREIAERAGLGFVGKNTLLLTHAFGSYLLLGEILVAGDLAGTGAPSRPTGRGEGPAAAAGTCGNCSRCQTACPTHAFPAPYILDSRLCISYLTIENKGPIPVELRAKMGNWIFGCDECQSVCPWVRQFRKSGRQRFLRFDPDVCTPRLVDLPALDDAGFKARFAGTPVLRPKRRGLLRNACVAMGNSGNRAVLAALEAAAGDAEPLIREHAEWALRRVAGQPPPSA